METAHPSMLDLLLETHIGLERQGPGSVEVIKQALEFLKPLDQFRKLQIYAVEQEHKRCF